MCWFAHFLERCWYSMTFYSTKNEYEETSIIIIVDCWKHQVDAFSSGEGLWFSVCVDEKHPFIILPSKYSKLWMISWFYYCHQSKITKEHHICIYIYMSCLVQGIPKKNTWKCRSVFVFHPTTFKVTRQGNGSKDDRQLSHSGRGILWACDLKAAPKRNVWS